MQMFAALGVPAGIAALVIVSDSFGSLALAIGLVGRFAALGTTMVMLGAMALVHGQNGFFLNWSGNQAGEGIQFHLLVVAVASRPRRPSSRAPNWRRASRPSIQRTLPRSSGESRGVLPTICPRRCSMVAPSRR
jgi:hypothetical protein